MLLSLFKKKKPDHPSLETQVQELKSLGLTFNESDAELIKQLTDQFDRKLYEEDPYSILISIAGTDLLDVDGNQLRLSYDILSFDTECVEDENIYSDMVGQFIRLTKGEVEISDLNSKVDFHEEIAHISFTFEQQRYEWDVSFNDDWFDVGVFERIATIVEKPDKKFIYFNDGQHLTIMYCTFPALRQINKLTKNKFKTLVR